MDSDCEYFVGSENDDHPEEAIPSWNGFHGNSDHPDKNMLFESSNLALNFDLLGNKAGESR